MNTFYPHLNLSEPSVTFPLLATKYPLAHKCLPQYCLFNSYSICNLWDKLPLRYCTNLLADKCGGTDTNKWLWSFPTCPANILRMLFVLALVFAALSSLLSQAFGIVLSILCDILSRLSNQVITSKRRRARASKKSSGKQLARPKATVKR